MIAVSITTTAKQDARLAEFLSMVNAARVAQGEQPFADVNALSTFMLRDQLVSSVQSMDEKEAEQVKAAYNAATNAVQAQVRTLLGVS